MTDTDIQTALQACQSVATRRSYEDALGEFKEWLEDKPLIYSVVREYRGYLLSRPKVQRGHEGEKMTPQTVNQALAAIRFYVRERAKEGVLTIEEAESIAGVENLTVKGRKLGNWLSIEEAEKLLNKPDVSKIAGLRDRAILALLIGGGLRRSEVVGLTISQFEKRDGRWVIIAIKGKHGRTRNVPIADWIKAVVDVWLERAQLKTGPVFRQVSRSEKKSWVKDEPLDATTLYHLVKRYGASVSLGQIAPHDLRRTCARLAYEGQIEQGKPDIKQIQLMLGHKKLETTEDYVNAQQNLQTAPSDVMGINVSV